MGKKILEICCDHLLSAIAAQAGGADRIELCSALATDGLTPSDGLLAATKKHLSIPVFVLIRPRPGNFVYTTEELEQMLIDIHHGKARGANGIVSGALRIDHSIHVEATAQLVAAARPLPFTFHKAFDLTPDPLEALDQLIEMGVNRVLTSGQAPSALAGMDILQKLAARGAGKIEILCGGGVRDHNLAELLNIPGLREYHSSALRSGPTSGSSYPTVDPEMVRQMQQLLC